MVSSTLYQRTERSDAILATSSALLVLAMLAVILRFTGMLVVRTHRFGWDDGFVLASMPFIIALNSLFIWSANAGILGGKLVGIHPGVFEDLQKFNYAAQLLFPLGISLPKFSCLFFYYRVFGRSSRKLYISLWVAGALAAGWLVSAIFVVAFQCNPPQKAWDFTLEGQCLSMWPWLVGLACTSMAIDALILIMPMPQLWKLNVPWRRKATVSIIFLCGYCVIVCSIGRVVTLGEELAAFSSPDPLYATAPYFCWISTEGPVSVVGVCLPMIFKFIQRVHDHGFRSGYTSQHSPQPGGSAYDNQHNRHRGKGSAKSDVQAPASAHGLREMTTGSRGERNSCSALDTPYLPDDEAKRKQTAQLDMV